MLEKIKTFFFVPAFIKIGLGGFFVFVFFSPFVAVAAFDVTPVDTKICRPNSNFDFTSLCNSQKNGGACFGFCHVVNKDCVYVGETDARPVCSLNSDEPNCKGMAGCVWADETSSNPSSKSGGLSSSDLEKLTRSSFLRTGTTDLKLIAGNFVQVAMGVIGSIALIMFIYGGFLFMTARGDSEHYEKGMSILLWSSLGVVVIFASYALLKFVFDIFT